MSPVKPTATTLDAEAVTALVTDAKYLFDHGAFGPLQQAEFFAALALALEPPPPEPDPEALTATKEKK